MAKGPYTEYGCTVARDKAACIAREMATKDWSPSKTRARNERLLDALTRPAVEPQKAGMICFGSLQEAEKYLAIEAPPGAWLRKRDNAWSVEAFAPLPRNRPEPVRKTKAKGKRGGKAKLSGQAKLQALIAARRGP